MNNPSAMNGSRQAAVIHTCLWTSSPENRNSPRRAAVLIENTADKVARSREGSAIRPARYITYTGPPIPNRPLMIPPASPVGIDHHLECVRMRS